MNAFNVTTSTAPHSLRLSTRVKELAASKLNIELYRKMYLIRKAEMAIRDHYTEDEMKTPMHMSMGGEAICVGLCHALKPRDQVLGTYRSHGIYLAKTMETDRFFAEMYGRETGTSNGKAGSMHLMAPEDGLICTSAIVASHIPVALGAAFANKMTNNGGTVAVFFGDGAIDEGVFWESLNFACLKKLQVLFVCEDNGYAVHVPAAERHGYASIAKIVERFDCDVYESASTDVEEIYRLAMRAIAGTHRQDRPAFLHLKYYRYLEHVGVFEDFKAGYRPKDEYDRWFAADPVRLQREKLFRFGAGGEVKRMEKAIDEQVNKSVARAKEAQFPGIQQLCKGLVA